MMPNLRFAGTPCHGTPTGRRLGIKRKFASPTYGSALVVNEVAQ